MGSSSLLTTTVASIFEAQVEDNSHRFDSTIHKENEMLAFRKWFLALALVILTVAVASAQNVPAFQCVANAGVPPLVRAEGIAELVGDLVLNCTGGYPASGVAGSAPAPTNIPLINVQIFLDVNVTSRLYETTNNSSEALLMIDEPLDAQQRICTGTVGTGGCSVAPLPLNPGGVYKPYVSGETTVNPYNMFQGRVQGANSVAWLGVPIDAPGTTFTRVIRMTNIRGNANMKGVSSTLVPSQIIAYISATGTTSVPINNPQQTVAWIQTGLTTAIRNPADDGGARTLSQCSHHNGDQYLDPLKDAYACPTQRLRYDEGFASSFKTRFDMGPTTGNNQNNPGAVFTSSESGFMRITDNAISGWGSLAGTAGVASQGTRLRAAFNNVPAGVRIFVTLRNGGYTSVNDAVLVNTAADGSGSFVAVPKVANTSGSCGSVWNSMEFAEIPIFGGSGVAVWEVVATSSLSIQRLDFGFIAAWRANTTNNLPGLGTITTNMSFAPLSTITTASTVAPVPRFADTSTARNTTTIVQCVTNLLFPYVTNVPGWDTGLVISNTTKDPWGHATEAGTCEINYYGDVAGGPPPPQQVSGVVPAGDYLAWGLSSGGKFGITATPGFQGYIIARCKFRYAHGYAFISDHGANRVANGYLALILDSPGYRGDVSTSENLGN
jgi:hypothetical protein